VYRKRGYQRFTAVWQGLAGLAYLEHLAGVLEGTMQNLQQTAEPKDNRTADEIMASFDLILLGALCRQDIKRIEERQRRRGELIQPVS
jgi:hypothetical protein